MQKNEVTTVLETKYPIYCLLAPGRRRLGLTLARFSEHYESPRFRGRIFSWSEFRDWQRSEDGTLGGFFFDRWAAYNLPDIAFDAFERGDFDPLSRRERDLIERLRDRPRPFYVIGAEAGRHDLLAHEFVHAIYYLEPDYAAEARRAVAPFDLEAMRQVLRENGYDSSVFDDEINAFLTADLIRPDLRSLELRQPQAACRQLFRKRFGWSVWESGEADRILGTCHRLDFRW